MVGVLLDDAAQAPAIGEVVLVVLEVQDDAGAALGLVDGFDVELAFTARGPVHAFAGGQAGTAGVDVDLVGDDEGAVEADAELADQLGVFLLVAGELAQEVTGAGLGDGAEVRDGILAAHADAVVVDGEGVGVGIEADTDAQVAVVFEQGRLGQRFKAQFVGGIGGVGDELAKEDFLVGVQRVDHQLQQLFDFGLEAQGLFLGLLGHGDDAPWTMPRPARRLAQGVGVVGWVFKSGGRSESQGPEPKPKPKPKPKHDARA